MKRFWQLILISTGILHLGGETLAQIDPNAFGFYTEALRFSQRSFGGTARIIGMGGAQVSLGGDISSALSNPAGLGFYNSSEAVLSPSIIFNDSESLYFGNTASDTKTKFNFNNLGFVIAKPQEDSAIEGFRGGSFSISAHKTNDFNNRITYESGFADVDFFDFILPDVNSGNSNTFTDLAFDAFMIDTFIDQDPGA